MKSHLLKKVKTFNPGMVPGYPALLNLILYVFCFLVITPTVVAQEAQHQKVSIQVGELTREFILYVPTQLPVNAPLLLSFSGMNQTDDFQAEQAKYWMVADTAKFIVVYPRAIHPNRSWDMTGPVDLDFTSAIIDTIYSRYAIDKTRVYASGFSWGANFCYRIANAMADKIAAIAPTMGHSWGPNPNVAISSRPMPVLQVTGTVDDVFKPEYVQPVLDKWIAHNGCSAGALVTKPYPASRLSSQAVKKLWMNATTGVEVVLLTTPKGHWHSNDSVNIMVNQEVWDFCKRYSTADFMGSAAERQVFANPVIYADVPDVNVVRVGDTYYMVSTTMHLMPGAPVMSSKDLVNWKIISYVFDEIKDSPQYDLLDGNVYGKGQWASSLRYHKGMFYVLFATNSPQRTYIFKTTNPAGKWELVSRQDRAYHDCSLFFDDDDRVYLVYGAGSIRIREFNADLSGPKTGGIDQELINGPAMGHEGLLEGTHVFKHDDKYYLYLIWWPRGGIRTQLCFRSDAITGIYESKVVLSNTLDRRGAGVAQGCIVDTPEGEWYGMLFQDRGAVGRVPVLMPCRWIDGWPVLGDAQGKVAKVMKSPLPLQEPTPLVVSDDFNTATLGITWQWNHNPTPTHWSLTERKGYMRLKTSRVVENVFQAPNTLSQRTEGPKCSATVKLDVSKMKEGDVAGLSVYCDEPGMLSVLMEGKKRYLVMSDRLVEKERIVLKGKEVLLRVDCDFDKGNDKATFYYSFDAKNWIKIGTEFQMIYNLRHFMGNRLAIYNYATKSTGGYVDVDYFKYTREKESAK